MEIAKRIFKGVNNGIAIPRKQPQESADRIAGIIKVLLKLSQKKIKKNSNKLIEKFLVEFFFIEVANKNSSKFL